MSRVSGGCACGFCRAGGRLGGSVPSEGTQCPPETIREQTGTRPRPGHILALEGRERAVYENRIAYLEGEIERAGNTISRQADMLAASALRIAGIRRALRNRPTDG